METIRTRIWQDVRVDKKETQPMRFRLKVLRTMV
jgi:translation elongation factor EF-1beta